MDVEIKPCQIANAADYERGYAVEPTGDLCCVAVTRERLVKGPGLALSVVARLVDDDGKTLEIGGREVVADRQTATIYARDGEIDIEGAMPQICHKAVRAALAKKATLEAWASLPPGPDGAD